MRPAILYGSILLSCLVIITVNADKKWKYEDENSASKNKKGAANGKEKNKKARSPKNHAVKDFDDSDEEIKPLGKSYQKKNKGKLANDNSSEEVVIKGNKGKKEVKSESEQKRFIGRIEHGKVKVLRRKEDKPGSDDDESDEDHKQKVCRKSRGGKQGDCDDDNDEENSEWSEEKAKPAKKMKYSIKFQHEKQKKKENNGDISIMRLHKNGKKRYGKNDDDDSSEEDDKPIKRFHFVDDDD